MSEATDKWESAVRAENARWIDRCVNSHDALVAALKGLLYTAKGCNCASVKAVAGPDAKCDECIARTALALAEKDGGE